MTEPPRMAPASCAWAVYTDHLDGELRRLRAAGIAVSGPIANWSTAAYAVSFPTTVKLPR